MKGKKKVRNKEINEGMMDIQELFIRTHSIGLSGEFDFIKREGQVAFVRFKGWW